MIYMDSVALCKLKIPILKEIQKKTTITAWNVLAQSNLTNGTNLIASFQRNLADLLDFHELKNSL